MFPPSADPDETARNLILHCMSLYPDDDADAAVSRAYAAFCRATDSMKKRTTGRPAKNDIAAEWMARVIQRDAGCSMAEARRQAARQFTKSEADAKRMAERLKDKQKKKTIPESPLIGISRVDVFTEHARKRTEWATRALWFWDWGENSRI